MIEQTQHEKQVVFLKDNEKEIVKKAFEIDGKMTVKDVHFDWSTVKVEQAGVMFQSPYALSVKVSSTLLSNEKTYADILIIKMNTDKLDKITNVSFK